MRIFPRLFYRNIEIFLNRNRNRNIGMPQKYRILCTQTIKHFSFKTLFPSLENVI